MLWAGRPRFPHKRDEASAFRSNRVGNQAHRVSIHPAPRTSTWRR